MATFVLRTCCSRCNKYYRGEFKKLNDGGYCCVECDNANYVEIGELVQTSFSDSDFKRSLANIYFNYLDEDVNIFYRFLGEDDSEFMSLFIEDDVLNHDMLFFQWNDFKFVEYMRTVALEFRNYLTKEFYKDLSLKWVKRYLSLRLNKLTEEEMQTWYLESELELMYLDDLEE